jgi:hypothetical protein
VRRTRRERITSALLLVTLPIWWPALMLYAACADDDPNETLTGPLITDEDFENVHLLEGADLNDPRVVRYIALRNAYASRRC